MAEEGTFIERTGRVAKAGEFKSVGKPPKSRQVGSFTIEIARQWQDKTFFDYLTFDCEGKVISQMQNIMAGDTVKVVFTITGSKWQDKYYNKLRAIKVETLSSSGAAYNGEAKTSATPAPSQGLSFPDNSDDLPF